MICRGEQSSVGATKPVPCTGSVPGELSLDDRSPHSTGRSWLVPEVIQTSAMDCGPAVLSALLNGFGLRAEYGRLREACQTDVDGTSIDVLEDISKSLGLDAEQVMLPVDHLLLPGSSVLPAIVVVLLPGGLMHFVLMWRRLGPFLRGSWTRLGDGGGCWLANSCARSTSTATSCRPECGAIGRHPMGSAIRCGLV